MPPSSTLYSPESANLSRLQLKCSAQQVGPRWGGSTLHCGGLRQQGALQLQFAVQQLRYRRRPVWRVLDHLHHSFWRRMCQPEETGSRGWDRWGNYLENWLLVLASLMWNSAFRCFMSLYIEHIWILYCKQALWRLQSGKLWWAFSWFPNQQSNNEESNWQINNNNENNLQSQP